MNAIAVGPLSRAFTMSLPASLDAIFIRRFLTTWYETFCLRSSRRIAPSSETLRPRYSETIIAVLDRVSSVKAATVSRLASVGIGSSFRVNGLASGGSARRCFLRSPLRTFRCVREPACAGFGPRKRLDLPALEAPVANNPIGLPYAQPARPGVHRFPDLPLGIASDGPNTRRPCDGVRHRGAATALVGAHVPASAWGQLWSA